MVKKKSSRRTIPRVNPELNGFDIKINSFGEIKTNYNIDRINEFLNREVDDKKLRGRDDLKLGKTSKKEQESESRKKSA